MDTEYNNIKNIGKTYEFSENSTENYIHKYYHHQEVRTVTNILKKLKTNQDEIIDLGCSIGFWFKNYKNIGFKKIIGIDISEERIKEAKQRGYDEVHACNAYDLPFENESKACIVSNNVLVHVLQDTDKLKIFKEIKRVLKKDGVFIVGIANASGYGHTKDVTIGTSRFSTLKIIKKMIEETGLNIIDIIPSYYTTPRIGAHQYFAKISSKIIFPLVDRFYEKRNNLSLAKVIYIVIKK
jgi:ubiquinone/menaquinone biosynthesis C-methylase UbiE